MVKYLALKNIIKLTKKKLISVIFPIYNASNYIDESLTSILNQTYNNFELILVNDGSTDDSLKKCKKYQQKDKRIKIINNEHQGLTKSLNDGIKSSLGTFIARQDADDISKKDRFEKQVNWFSFSNKRVLCGTNGFVVSPNGKIKQNKVISFDHNKIINKLRYTNCFMHTSVMFLKSAGKQFNFYNENLKYAQDYDLWWKLSTLGEVGNIPDKLVTVKRLKDSITLNKANEQTTDFINSSAEYFIHRNTKLKVEKLKKTEHYDVNLHKKIMQFFYNDSLDNKVKFNDLTLKEKIISINYLSLYMRKISKFLKK